MTMQVKSEEFRKGFCIIIAFTCKSHKNYRCFLLTSKVLSHFLVHVFSLLFLVSSRFSTALGQAGHGLLFPDRVIMLYRTAFLLVWTSTFLQFLQSQKLQTLLRIAVQIQVSQLTPQEKKGQVISMCCSTK